MTELDPLHPRPAATVMLVRDTPEGIKIFLMRRHSAMDFVAGVMVFPGGGVDDRDRNADVAWHGPDRNWWAERFGVDRDRCGLGQFGQGAQPGRQRGEERFEAQS